jgi:tetratricopeptide (TPR) repeat protein
VKIKVLEIISILLLISGVVSIHLTDEVYGWFMGPRFMIPVIYAIGGYFIFKPDKTIKFGTGIIITNGLLLSAVIFIAFSTISIGIINNTSSMWLIFGILFLCIAGLLLLLYVKNKGLPENKPFIKSVMIRNACILMFCMILLAIPNRWRVTVFHGTNSSAWFKLRQFETMEESNRYIAVNDYQSAIDRALQSVNYSLQRNDSVSNHYMESMNALAYAYFMGDNFRSADSVCQKVLMVNRNDLHDDDFEDARQHALYNYAMSSSGEGYYDTSDSLLDICINYPGNATIRLAYIYSIKAGNQKEKGNLITADSLYHLSLVKHKDSGFKNRSHYISTLNDLAIIYSERALYTQADSVFSIALQEAKKEYGEQSMKYAGVLDHLMVLNITLADYSKAETLGTKSLEIKKKLVGIEDAEYLYTLIKMTSIQMEKSNYENIQSTLLHCLSVIERKYSVKSPFACSVYDNLVSFYEDQEQLQKAVMYADKSLEARTDYYGRFNINTAISIEDKAYLYYCDERLNEADSMYYKALRIKKHFTGRDNPGFAKSLNGLGLVFAAKGNLLKADTVFNYALEIVENCVGTQHPSYAQILNNKGYLEIQKHQFEKATIYLQESLNSNITNFGEVHLKVAENYVCFAYLKQQQHLDQEALSYFQKAGSIYRSIFNTAHPKAILMDQEISLLEKSGKTK